MTPPPKTPKRRPVVASKALRITFGKRLREERLAAGLSQDRVAQLAKLDRMHVSEIERGQQNITFETASVLARVVGFDIEVVWQPRVTHPRPKK